MNDDKQHFIKEELDQRRRDNRFRSLRVLDPHYGDGAFVKTGEGTWVNFSSNDYLGLSGDPRVMERAKSHIDQYGAGSTASRLICGTYDIHRKLEEQLSDTFEREAALLFNTGFQANSSILATLTDRNSLILTDKRSHNSLLQGALLSRARFRRFDHNDLDDLERHLQKAEDEDYNRIFIVTESVFSMDGDRPDLEKLVDLSNRYRTFLFVDEAHAVGIWGEQGKGLSFGLDGIDMVLGTFGKAFGSFGSFLLCSKEVRDYLINFCPGFIYTTALPPAVIGANRASLELLPELDKERKKLVQNAEFLKEQLAESGFDTGNSTSQIVPIIIGSEADTLKLQDYLGKEGMLATAIRPPTVEKGKSRIRVTLSSKHDRKHLNKLIHLLHEWKQR